MNGYEAVVIGAGNAGMTAAATLAKSGVRTLLLERHNIPGGCATSFCRGRFEFEVALHQLSGLGSAAAPGPLRSTLYGLDVLDRVEFVEMKNLYRVAVPGQLDITLPANREGVVRALQERFPEEGEAIEAFFDLVYDYFNQFIAIFFLRDPEVTREKYPLYFEYALKPAQEVLDRHFRDPLLKLALGAYWCYIGVPPRLLPFGDLAALLLRLHRVQAVPHSGRLPGPLQRPRRRLHPERGRGPLQLPRREDFRRGRPRRRRRHRGGRGDFREVCHLQRLHPDDVHGADRPEGLPAGAAGNHERHDGGAVGGLPLRRARLPAGGRRHS